MIRTLNAILLSSFLVAGAASGAGPDGAAAAEQPAGSAPTLQDVIPKELDSYLIALLYAGENASRISAAQREQFAVAHLANLRDRVLDGSLLAAGPFQGGPEQPVRGIAIARGNVTPEQLRALFAEDPFLKSGAMRLEILPWMTSKGGICWPETPVW